MLRLALVVALLGSLSACNCGPAKKLGAKCTSGMGTFDTPQADCASGLICDINDACDSNCPGTCAKPCTVNADCPAPCTCSGNSRFSSTNQICAGTGC
jgi:hypothetical protein